MLTNAINNVVDFQKQSNEDTKNSLNSATLNNNLETNFNSCNKQQSSSPSLQNSFLSNLSNSSPNQTQPKDCFQINSSFIIKNSVKSGQLFGPFQNLIPWLALQNCKNKQELPKELYSLDPDLLSLFLDVQIATNEEEQNMEIILKNNKFYFKALQTIENLNGTNNLNESVKHESENLTQEDQPKNENVNCENNKLSEPSNLKKFFAWFSSELSARLPSPSLSILNGTKRFYCSRCNQMFIHQNLATLHIIYDCSNSEEQNLSFNKSNVNQFKSTNNFSPIKSLFNNNPTSNTSSNDNLKPKTTLSVVNTSSPSSVSSNMITSSCLNLSNSNKQQTSNNNIFNKSNKEKTSSINNKLNNNLSTTSSSSSSSISSSSSPSSSSLNNVQNLNKSNKSVKKRAFDIDFLVNSDCNQNQALDQINQSNNTSKKNKIDHTIDYKLNKNTNKSDLNKNCTFKTPSSCLTVSKLNETNSTLINSLNSPLMNTINNSASRFNTPLFNPFSLFDQTLASNLPNAFPKIDTSPLPSPLLNKTSSFKNSSNNVLNNDSLNLVNAAAMFNPNFANPFDFATIYAQHQQSLLQSMFPTTHVNNVNIPSTSINSNHNSLLNSNTAQSYFQNQLLNANTLFASQNLANLSTLNSLNNFNGLTNLLNSTNSAQANSALSSLTSNLSPSLASSLFVNLPATAAANAASLVHQTQLANQLAPTSFPPNPDSFIGPSSINTNEKLNSKKKKQKEKDLNTLNSKSSVNNQLNVNNLLNNSNNNSNSIRNNQNNLPLINEPKVNSSIPPYLQYLPPSLAALSFPQSNWCAKCNISFRMTSDLVYHMRSQHKESGSSNGSSPVSSSSSKKKREENKLICHICKEGFKERHHLTRHMTSHN